MSESKKKIKLAKSPVLMVVLGCIVYDVDFLFCIRTVGCEARWSKQCLYIVRAAKANEQTDSTPN